MEHTKIPKPTSGIKPPTKINHSGPPSRNGVGVKISSTILEDKVATASVARPAVKVPSQPPKNALKRRSKSVTDLRPLSSRPINILKPVVKPLDKGNAVKVGQKRPSNKSNEEVKQPKVQKVKIPDWDYKSRFHELQKKYTALQEESKENKNKLSSLTSIESELKFLHQDNSNKQNQIDVLKTTNDVITQENSVLQNENQRVNNELAKLQEAYQALKNQNENLMEKNKENLEKIEALQKSYTQLQSEHDILSTKYNNSECTVLHLKEILEEHENLRRILHNNIQDLKGNIRVFCRVRPPVNDEENSKLLCAIHFPDENSLEIRKSRESVSTISGKPSDFKQEFSFDKVFPPEASQSEVFEELSQLVQSALDGFHVCVFAYGQTGSGKTFTMQGLPHDHGMIPRTIDLIFEKIQKLTLTGWKYIVTASFLEIYNENVKDLLEPNSTHNYEIRYNEGRGVTVTNLKIISIKSADEMRLYMEEALKNRAVASTDFNLHSSRSHAVTKIHLKGYNNTSKLTYRGSINLVDLAGSESAKTSSSERLTETKNINKSLSTLGNVMLALHNRDSHIPYRNSKLTFLLQSCLGGNSKTLMFVNISPFEECYMESISSLRFAAKVKEIKTHAKKNKTYLNIPPLQSSKSVL